MEAYRGYYQQRLSYTSEGGVLEECPGHETLTFDSEKGTDVWIEFNGEIVKARIQKKRVQFVTTRGEERERLGDKKKVAKFNLWIYKYKKPTLRTKDEGAGND